MNPTRRTPVQIILTLFFGVLAGRLFWVAWQNSMDFSVYWNAARAWVHFANPYLIHPEDRGFVFKYAPWVLPFFAPFGFMSWSVAKALWVLIETISLAYALDWTSRRSRSRVAAWSCGLLYWWIWLGHFSMGQLALPILAVSLWACAAVEDETKRATWPVVSALVGLSGKVFSLASAIGLVINDKARRRVLNRRSAGAVILFAILIHFLLLTVSYDSNLGVLGSFRRLYSDWMVAASSGNAELGAEVVRGPANHGLPAMVFRFLGMRQVSALGDVLAFLFSFGILGATWALISRPLRFAEQWAGWLALGVIAHPLAWHHSFVLVYPLSAFSLSAAFESGRRGAILAAVVGVALIGLFIPQVLGVERVRIFEFAGCKVWGTLLGAAVLVHSRRAPGAVQVVA